MEPLFLTLAEVLEIHDQQIQLYGGSIGLRDQHGLDSAIATPQATFGGVYLHATIPSMAAAYLFHLCQNHAFIDGNKRVGANSAVTFLWLNGWEPTFDADQMIELVLGVASGQLGKPEVTKFFEANSHPTESLA
jgi:death-on-curing protein